MDTINTINRITLAREPSWISTYIRSAMDTIEFKLKGEHIRLCDLLKLAGISDSGGQGKRLVAAGEVKVDGQSESRKTAKIRAGQIVECRDVRIYVVLAV